MKILIVTPIFPPEIGGPATYTSELAKRLAKNHQVSVITFANYPSRISHFAFPVFPIPTTGNFLTRQWALFRAILKTTKVADSIYSQGTLVVGLMSLFASYVSHRPLIIKFVGDEYWELMRREGKTTASLEDFYKKPPLSLHLLLHRLSLRFASRIIVPSQYLKDFLVSAHQINPVTISVIPNAIGLSQLLPIKKKPHQLIFVGRLVSWKNVDQIIKAVTIARKSKPWQLVIIGDGPEKSKLPKADWIQYLGTLSHKETLEHIAASQKLILYSTYEGQPHTLIEAMKLGTAIVASNIAPNKEILNGHGHLVSLNQPQKLAEAINAPSKNLPAAGKYAQKFSWDNHLAKLQEIL